MALAEWSLHKTILEDKTVDNLDFAATDRHTYGIEFSGTKPEDEGIRLTKALLEAVGAELG